MNCATQLKATQLVYSTAKSGRDGKAGKGSRVVMGNGKPFQQVKTMLKKRPEIRMEPLLASCVPECMSTALSKMQDV